MDQLVLRYNGNLTSAPTAAVTLQGQAGELPGDGERSPPTRRRWC